VLEGPGLIVGLIIAVMGISLIVLGLGIAFTTPNRLTLGTGLALLAIGVAVNWGSRTPKGTRRS
ncbi:MAG: hypothetical protein ABI072_01430, partial [Edaphobacter sp.]